MTRILTVPLLLFSLIPANALTISQTASGIATTSWAGSSSGGLGSALFFEQFSYQPHSLARVDFTLTISLVADVTDVNPFGFDLWADPNLFMTAQASTLGDASLDFYEFGETISGESAPILLAPGESTSRQHVLTDSLSWSSTSLTDLEYFIGDAPVGFLAGAALFSLSSYGGGNATLQMAGEITYHYDPPKMAAGTALLLVPETGASAVLLAISAGALTWFFRRNTTV